MTNQAGDLILVLITAPSREAAEQLARQLLQERLAACVNLVSGVQSLYWWEGEIQSELEALLIVKARKEGFQEHFIPFVRQHHPYEVPEILALPILAGNEEYLKWALGETGSKPA
ncbi:MAG: divalent-cation tolerance protein CutA [Anaerolineales bacterium]|nr:divalent-cation tolerance protein CutA [Anaerolineales bacterium]MCS7247514.1 divalent-cation tolerance protein CutA [Anaerolineales bacterium]MDW8161325.1 divalent-cation tolerance protein CutA [Anaerolineales bacterium]MDW8446580.1 divalent-cation tolerance protein CutA [Anaerolineales bacterium]